MNSLSGPNLGRLYRLHKLASAKFAKRPDNAGVSPTVKCLILIELEQQKAPRLRKQSGASIPVLGGTGMSITLSTPSAHVNATTARRRLAASLLRDWRSAMAIASVDHAEGRHVGFDGDAVACGACLFGGDYPEGHELTREQLLERNIADMSKMMQMRADLSSMERMAAA